MVTRKSYMIHTNKKSYTPSKVATLNILECVIAHSFVISNQSCFLVKCIMYVRS